MPIDYKKYPKNWKSEIRPAILERANNKCEVCGVANYEYIFRCTYFGKECYQTADGDLFDADNSEPIETYTQFLDLIPTGQDKAIRVVLTISHLNHNINDNRHENLKAMCQRCHLRYDVKQHKHIRLKKKFIKSLF